jgi:hypothetical protein
MMLQYRGIPYWSSSCAVQQHENVLSAIALTYRGTLHLIARFAIADNTRSQLSERVLTYRGACYRSA